MTLDPLVTTILLYLLLILIGVIIGFLAAIAGIGGGVLLVPVLAIFFSLEDKLDYATATSLFIIIFTGIASAYKYNRKGLVDKKIGLMFAPVTMIGAFIGAYLKGFMTNDVLKYLFATFLIYVALRMLFGKKLSINSEKLNVFLDKIEIHKEKRQIVDETGEAFEYEVRLTFGMFLAFFAGIASGVFGIGGGAVMVPVLNLVVGMPFYISTATSMFIIMFTAFSGSVANFLRGTIIFEYGISLAIGIIPGAYLGAKNVKRFKQDTLKKIFGTLLIFTAIKLFVGTQAIVDFISFLIGG